MRDWKAIIFNSTVSAVASRVLISTIGFIPAVVIGSVAYELNPLEKLKQAVHYVRSLKT